ncbi:hypothetical protein CALCODRAFT_503929 [Calocera cornea HHB12733]|uniref:Uncharacterized protein n=1 Tax=Calocera cornea HHB12733 TaxID=1353952 RepID=A0A165CNR8_9BASI|nr:hypothetical protein CALCODRAFT_503929 [Calocera cornea HHB12733]
MNIQAHKSPPGVRTSMLEVYRCPAVPVDLEVRWAAPCLIKHPSSFTGKVDLHVTKRDTITLEDALKPRTSVLNEEPKSQLLWIGEYTPGKQESEFDRCSIRTQGGTTLGVWEEDPDFASEDGALWTPVVPGPKEDGMGKLKAVASRSPARRPLQKLFAPEVLVFVELFRI